MIEAVSYSGSLTSAIKPIKRPFDGNISLPLFLDRSELLSAGVHTNYSSSKLALMDMPLQRTMKKSMDSQKTLHVWFVRMRPHFPKIV